MILMLAAAGYADGDYRLAEENPDVLRTWCQYLLKYGEDPAEQLCTMTLPAICPEMLTYRLRHSAVSPPLPMILRACNQENKA